MKKSFVPISKQSKKAQKTYHSAQRSTWGILNIIINNSIVPTAKALGAFTFLLFFILNYYSTRRHKMQYYLKKRKYAAIKKPSQTFR